jgi:hypothetical protein
VLIAVRDWHAHTTIQGSSASGATPALDQLTQQTMDRLQSQMSPSGFASLMNLVRLKKRNMRRIVQP